MKLKTNYFLTMLATFAVIGLTANTSYAQSYDYYLGSGGGGGSSYSTGGYIDNITVYGTQPTSTYNSYDWNAYNSNYNNTYSGSTGSGSYYGGSAVVGAAVTQAYVDDLLEATEDLIDETLDSDIIDVEDFSKKAEKLEDMLNELDRIEAENPGKFNGLDGKMDRIADALGEMFGKFWSKLSGVLTPSIASKLARVASIAGVCGGTGGTACAVGGIILTAVEVLYLVEGAIVTYMQFQDYFDRGDVQTYFNPYNPYGVSNPYTSAPTYKNIDSKESYNSREYLY